jgi:hypothetical protein
MAGSAHQGGQPHMLLKVRVTLGKAGLYKLIIFEVDHADASEL